tara:strand:+ start:2736 stop:4127 length:1392 start_codon:yes stop_codon:yes gene_type:complete
MHPLTPPDAKITPQRALLQARIDDLRALETASSAAIQAYQNRALAALFNHACRYSAFWRERLGHAAYQLTRQSGSDWARHSLNNPGQPVRIMADNVRELLSVTPTLSRFDLQQSFEQLRARPPEMTPERIITASTSGSTGSPVRVEKDEPVYGLFYSANSWVECQWHQRDPRKKIAVTLMNRDLNSAESWGGVFDLMGLRGPSVSRGLMRGDIASHLDWLLAEKPAYLKCTAAVAAELAELALERGASLQLEQILSQSERVSPKQRLLCKRAFGATIADRYSCEEVGWLAIQCPTHQNFHVTSGTVLLEILDDNNQPCPQGVPGRVVATSLHSFAMPMIRYELGDLAQCGPPCPCGIALPVLGALHGRIRHRVHMPDGTRAMPFLGDELGLLPVIRQFRIIQHPSLALELQVVAHSPLSGADVAEIKRIFSNNALDALPLTITQATKIDWPADRKREEFVSLV